MVVYWSCDPQRFDSDLYSIPWKRTARQILDRPLNKPTHSALFDANFAGSGATWLILKHQLYILEVSVLDERIGDFASMDPKRRGR